MTKDMGRRLIRFLVGDATDATSPSVIRRLSAAFGRAARRAFALAGFHLLRKHYYLPIPQDEDLTGGYFERESVLPGCDMNDRVGHVLLNEIFPPYVEEFRRSVPLENPPGADPGRFHLINGTFMAVDAHAYYALIRHGKPRRIVEIGGGNSSLVAAMACVRNREEKGHATRLTVIDPYPSQGLRRGFPGLSELIEAKVQDVGLEPFTSLAAGDVLFIDSSHVLRAGGDVQYEYLEILPRLAPGVLVHIHDVSLPKPYPRVYFEQGMYWNEQDLLQAFLAFNSRFEVLWAGNFMLLRYPEKVMGIFPEIADMRRFYPQAEPTSFWMRVRP